MRNFKILNTSDASSQRSGNIKEIILGQADELQDTVLTIRILVNFSYLRKAERESAIENLFVEFELAGGSSELQQYSFDSELDLVIAPNQNILSITSQIDLI